MNIKRSTLNIILVVSLAFVLIVIVVSGAARKWINAKSQEANGSQKQQEERVTDTLPPVISSIKGIEVVSAFIDGHGRANITVVNKTGKGITALAISSGNFMFSDDNGLAQNDPKVLIAPYSSYTFEEPISNLRAGRPLRISAALYDDGTEDGDTDVRKNIHAARDKEKERRSSQSKKDKGN